MKMLKSHSIVLLRGIIPALLVFAANLVHATDIIWNGPTINFTHSTPTGNLSDQLTPGVILTRSASGGLYNSATESGAVSGSSPADTAWAVGSLANYNTLTYGACPLEAGNHPPGYVNTTFVVHLISEDIYLSVKLTSWGGAGGAGDKSFSYARSTLAAVPPTIGITNPASGAVFAAPANVSILTTNSGTVTNVQFFTNGVSLKSVLTAPFSITASNLTAGAYALTAVATASGLSATSTVVNVSVVSPVTISLSGASISNSQFRFSYTANAGLSYVVQSSTNLLSWVSLTTNIAPSSPVPFTNAVNSTGAKFYRVTRLPNP
jgi:hypothetical protein